MKQFIPHLIALILILAFLALGSGNHTRLRTLEIEKEALLEKAATLGINLERPRPLSTRSRPRAGRANFKAIAAEFIACGVTFKDYYHQDFHKLSEAERLRIIAAIEGVTSLNAKQLKSLVDLINNDSSIDQYISRRLLTFALIEWGHQNPKDSLDELASSETLIEERFHYRKIHRAVIPAWLAQDPEGALRWMREARPLFPEKSRSSLTYEFAKDLLKHRPLEAFDLLHEISDRPSQYFPGFFHRQNLTTAQRSQVLTRLREMAAKMTDDVGKKYLSKNLEALLIGQVQNEGSFKEAIAMIEANQLEAKELEFLWKSAGSHLGYYTKEMETGQWISWLRETSPEGSAQKVKQLIENWQKRDPKAAAIFLEENGE